MTNRPGGASFTWRTVDIIVTAVLAVACGVLFFAWNNVYPLFGTLFAAYPPAQAIAYGVWMLPGVLCALVVRRPGAAVFGSTVASTVSVFFGAPQPLMIVLWGFAQGALPELVFLITRYRRFGLGIALVAGALSGLWAGVLDPILWMPTWPPEHRIAYLVFVLISGAAIGGAGAWALVRALRPTGVLALFPSGSAPSGPAPSGSASTDPAPAVDSPGDSTDPAHR